MAPSNGSLVRSFPLTIWRPDIGRSTSCPLRSLGALVLEPWFNLDWCNNDVHKASSAYYTIDEMTRRTHSASRDAPPLVHSPPQARQPTRVCQQDSDGG